METVERFCAHPRVPEDYLVDERLPLRCMEAIEFLLEQGFDEEGIATSFYCDPDDLEVDPSVPLWVINQSDPEVVRSEENDWLMETTRKCARFHDHLELYLRTMGDDDPDYEEALELIASQAYKIFNHYYPNGLQLSQAEVDELLTSHSNILPKILGWFVGHGLLPSPETAGKLFNKYKAETDYEWKYAGRKLKEAIAMARK